MSVCQSIWVVHVSDSETGNCLIPNGKCCWHWRQTRYIPFAVSTWAGFGIHSACGMFMKRPTSSISMLFRMCAGNSLPLSVQTRIRCMHMWWYICSTTLCRTLSIVCSHTACTVCVPNVRLHITNMQSSYERLVAHTRTQTHTTNTITTSIYIHNPTSTSATSAKTTKTGNYAENVKYSSLACVCLCEQSASERAEFALNARTRSY